MVNRPNYAEKHSVFTYGTLMSEAVLQIVLGRVPQRVDGVLHNYHRRPILGQVYPAVTSAPGKSVLGKVVRNLTTAEIVVLDAFEDPAYERCLLPVVLNSGEQISARVWVRPIENVDDLDTENDWSYDTFRANHECEYLNRCKEWLMRYRSSEDSTQLDSA